MRTTTKAILIVMILVAATLSGCISKSKVQTETYRCSVDDGVLYLSSDMTYEMILPTSTGGGGLYGDYTQRDHMILLKRAFLGDVVPFVIDATTPDNATSYDLIDPDGDRWVRD